MRKPILAALTVVTLASLAQAATPPGFLTDLSAAKAQAAKEGKPIYIHFTEARCIWCRVMENTVYTSDIGKKALRGFVAVSLDCTPGVPSAEQNDAMMRKYGGEGFPYLVMTTPTGETLFAEGSYRPAKQFARELDAVGAYYEFRKDGEKYDRKDYDQAAKALKIYADIEMWTKAEPAADAVLRLDPEDKKGNNALATYVRIGLLNEEQPRTAAALKMLAAKLKIQCDKIRQLDPENAKGVLEKALFFDGLVLAHLAGNEDDPQKLKAGFQKAIGVLDELTSKAKTLEQAQDVWFMLFRMHAMIEQYDEAVKAIDEAIAVDPKSPTVSQFQAYRQAVVAEKAKKP